MRILFWSLGLLPEIGGIEVLAATLLPAMRQRGHEYLVVTSRRDPSLAEQTLYQGIPIHRYPFRQSLGNVDELASVKQRVSKLKQLFAPDLIHLNGLGRDIFFHLVTAGAHPAPLLITLHGEWAPQADALVGSALRKADWVAGCSDAILKMANDWCPRSYLTRVSSITPWRSHPLLLNLCPLTHNGCSAWAACLRKKVSI